MNRQKTQGHTSHIDKDAAAAAAAEVVPSKKIILTGDRPTGRLHLGHYVGSLRQRVTMQNSGDYDQIYIMIADAQALTDNAHNPEKVRQNVLEVTLDYLSVGIDPAKTCIFIQSQVPELFELTMYYMDLVTVARVQRNPTVKNEIKQKNFNADVPLGFFCYPISQAADITAFKATTVPVGEDQLPMLEQAREIVHAFNSTYAPVLVKPQAVVPSDKAAKRLPGLDGKAKMSKSLGNCIYLSDDAETVSKKVKTMYTDTHHIHLNDPGRVEGNTVFSYLEAFATDEDFKEFWPDYQNLSELEDHYRRGGLGDMACKRFLDKVLQKNLDPIRTKRAQLEQNIPAVYDMLEQGSKKAERVAARTLSEVKDAMRINYFSDSDLVNDQAKRYQK